MSGERVVPSIVSACPPAGPWLAEASSGSAGVPVRGVPGPVWGVRVYLHHCGAGISIPRVSHNTAKRARGQAGKFGGVGQFENRMTIYGTLRH